MKAQADGTVRIKDLSFSYYGSSAKVLDAINLEIKNGEIVVVAGHSGSGKSTLLRCVNGLIPHQHTGEYRGSVTVGGGIEVATSKMSDIARVVGYVFQNPENQIFMFSVERDIAFGLENLALPREQIRKRVDDAMDMLGISHLALRAPHELSDGQKQRVAIAGVIAMQPRILILDEPSSLLDPFTASDVFSVVQTLHDNLNLTVMIVEHRLDLVAKIASRIVVLDKGRVAMDGQPREVLSKQEVSLHGVTEPTIVRLAKISGMNKQPLPLDAREFQRQLV